MEEEYEIKSAHEAAIEHGAEHHVALAQKIALFSAVVATIGAVFSFLAGHTQNEALYHKDEAVLLKAQASDQWAYFQAESGKQHVATVAAELVPAAKRDVYLRQVKTYTVKKADAPAQGRSARPALGRSRSRGRACARAAQQALARHDLHPDRDRPGLDRRADPPALAAPRRDGDRDRRHRDRHRRLDARS